MDDCSDLDGEAMNPSIEEMAAASHKAVEEHIQRMAWTHTLWNRIIFWVFTISAFVLGWLSYSWIHG